MAINDVNAGSTPIQGGQVPLSSYAGPTQVDLDPYPISYMQHIAGGWRSVATLADLFAITTDRRQEGMIAYVEENQTIYILREDLVTWDVYSTGAGGLPDLIVRAFQNEVQIVLRPTPRPPLVQVYLETVGGIDQPLIYGDVDLAIYGAPEYNQIAVPSFDLWSFYQQPPDLRIEYIPTAQQTNINFNTPRNGIAVAVL